MTPWDLFLFTVRNGSQEEMRAKRGKLYCEKLMVVEVDQVTPMHFHWNKVEDIINRGGGKLDIQLYNATDRGRTGGLGRGGQHRRCQARSARQETCVRLEPGESITLTPRLYHEFWAEKGRTLVGEVSLVNDDRTDNRFYENVGRFPAIEEDTEPLHLLVSDYEKYYGASRK